MMKKRRPRFRKVHLEDLDDKTLLINVYITQLLTLVMAFAVLWLQGRSPASLLAVPDDPRIWFWGAGFAALVVLVDWQLSRFVPAEMMDDGGVNERIFRSLPLWHIAVLCMVVAVCEELLFRGAIQEGIGPYWTSVLFAAIHVRYLRHWLMTGLVFAISYGLGWIYIQTGSLWTPILAHFCIDFIMGCIVRFRREP